MVTLALTQINQFNRDLSGGGIRLIKRIPRLKIFFCGLECFFCYGQKLYKLKESEKLGRIRNFKSLNMIF